MVTNVEICSDLPIPPGEYLEEVLEALGMAKDELARRTNRPASKLSSIFKGTKAITADTALQLEKVVGVPAHIWVGLEADYRLAVARQREARQRDHLKEEVPLVKLFCYSKLVQIGAVSKFTKAEDKVLALQKFFGVTSLHNVRAVRRYMAAFRCGKVMNKCSAEAVVAWLRLGELKAREVDCAPFSKSKLETALAEIRGMLMLPPNEFLSKLTCLLAGVGVALILCPHLPKTYAHGATFPLGREKTVLMLSIRGKWADVFWFSLFHELGYVLLHGRNAMFVEYDNVDSNMKLQDLEADEFAANILIPLNEWSTFIQLKSFFPVDILKFAKEQKINAGIVVGRLQHEGFLKPAWGNNLRTRYNWV